MIDPARSFDHAAEAYEEARPGYPDELLDGVPLAADATVLDLAAGTGKLTRILARRYAHVIAVEPLDGMRAVLARVVPEADARAGSAEAIPLGDVSVDAVFVATAFHWFATDAAVAEIARVLRPGGVLAVVGNETVEPTPLPEAYIARTRALFDDVYTGAKLDEQLEAIARGPFGEIHEAHVHHEQVQDQGAVLHFMSSVSAVARNPPEERARLLEELAALLPEGEYRFTVDASIRWTTRR